MLPCRKSWGKCPLAFQRLTELNDQNQSLFPWQVAIHKLRYEVIAGKFVCAWRGSFAGGSFETDGQTLNLT